MNKNNYKIKMTGEEKKRISAHLKSVLALTPEATPSLIELIRSPYTFHFSRQKVFVLSALAVFLITFGTSFAATNALPGDSLYSIKTNFNEKIEGFFATNPKAKAAHEIKIALRRLDEAEKLEVEGRLDADTKAEIETNFHSHVGNLANTLKEVEPKEAVSVAVDLQTGLESRKKALSRLVGEERDGRGRVHIVTLLNNIDEEQKSLEKEINARVKDSDEEEGDDEMATTTASSTIDLQSNAGDENEDNEEGIDKGGGEAKVLIGASTTLNILKHKGHGL